MENNQIKLSPKIYCIYKFFEKSRNINWKENPFKKSKNIGNYNFEVKIAKNISNLNFYIIDIPINEKINPSYIIYYLKNIDYRNIFSSDIIKFRLVEKITKNNWIEEEIYHGSINKFTCYSTKFSILFFNDILDETNNLSETKYYNNLIILKDIKNNRYVLRFEIVLNHLDIDQEIDINIYLNMIVKIIKASHQVLKINFNMDDYLIKQNINIINEDEINNKGTQTLETYINEKCLILNLNDKINEI